MSTDLAAHHAAHRSVHTATDAVERTIGRLPAGVMTVARDWADRAHAVLGLPAASDTALARSIALPVVLEADWPGPAEPRRVGCAGDPGWVQADVTDDDLDTFDRLRSSLGPAGAEEVAARAQEWRLPVLPYRHRSPDPEWGVVLPAGAPLPAIGLRVLDLSTLWAGPSLTGLLRQAGARVTKVEPDCRPDGFRERPNLYAELNRDKEIVDLDLRRPADRVRFEALVADADVLVSSFSRRVLPNLGYDRSALAALNPGLRQLSIVGFPSGCPEADWLTYGSGIHAICGLGWDPEPAHGSPSAPPTPPPVAHPDPLTAFLGVILLAAAPPGSCTEVPLVAAGAAVAVASTTAGEATR